MLHVLRPLTEWESQVQAAEEKFLHIAPDNEFQHNVETLEQEKFDVAKHINNLESTCQNLERTHAALLTQKVALDRMEQTLRRLDEVEQELSRQLGLDGAQLSENPELQQQVLR